MQVDCLCVGTGRLMTNVFHEIQGIRSFNIEVICGPVNSEGIFLSPLV